jgi:serine/threonine-protein kinase HipA
MSSGPAHDRSCSAADVYKDGLLAAEMWRTGDTVAFRYRTEYVAAAGDPIASTLPVTSETVEVSDFHVPPFFAGLLPEGPARRRDVQRAFGLATDDELDLLVLLGAETVGDVQVVPAGRALPSDQILPARYWSERAFDEMWRDVTAGCLPGVHPKMSAQSRGYDGAASVILKLPIEGCRGVLSNEKFFLRHGTDVGLQTPPVRIVRDGTGERALEVTRFDRSVENGRLVRHAQEDACQVLGLRPEQKYDPDGRTVISALAGRCAAPRVAVRDLFHQLVYSYVIGNNNVHAKNLSIRRDPESRLWTVTPIYDVLHTWSYEDDHRFHPAIRSDGPHDTVKLEHWIALADDLGLPPKAAQVLIDRVIAAQPELERTAMLDIDAPREWLDDLRHVLRRRASDLQPD